MQTREELLNDLNTAVSIIRRLGNIQQRLNQVRSKYKPHKKMGKLAKFFIGLFVFCAISSLFISGISQAITYSIETAIIYIAIKYFYKQVNLKIDSQNEAIKASEEQPILNDLQKVQADYREYLSSWYPENYCSVDAVEFFYNAVKNFRADNLKEAINLYETALHQRRVEANQAQAVKQQKLNNLLSVGNIIMQGATLGEISSQNARQTLAMQDANNTLNSIKNRLR